MPDGPSSAEPQAPILAYDEIFVCEGLSVPFIPDLMPPPIERPLRSGRYEAGERRLLQGLVRQDDRVLDLGGGLGLVAATAEKLATSGEVLTIEAHPGLLPAIRETWRLNDVSRARLRHGMVGRADGPPATFYIRPNFWASSPDPGVFRYVDRVPVPVLGLDTLVGEFRPSVITCDIEGAELDLFEETDLSDVRAVVIETHPKVYGSDGVAKVLGDLERAGLKARPQKRKSSVYVFERPARPTRRPEARTPRVLVATCMKNEGPFVLEWLAWHKAIGVTDFVVFSNDCTDGTDRLLDRLDAMGEITHLPNPASLSESTFFQPVALAYVSRMPVFRSADYVLSIDVDEFVNVKVGDGTLAALFEATGPFDVISFSENVHGSNGRNSYERGWVTELFPRHAPTRPGKWKARSGIKSLTRLSPRIRKIRNHRPDLSDDVKDPVWLDGSGRQMDDLMDDAGLNGIDRRERMDFAAIEHFANRSAESFLVKMDRGDVVVKGKQVSERYWRLRNRNDVLEHDLSSGIARARRSYAALEKDSLLMQLHEECCQAHEDRIRVLTSDPQIRKRLDRLARSVDTEVS